MQILQQGPLFLQTVSPRFSPGHTRMLRGTLQGSAGDSALCCLHRQCHWKVTPIITIAVKFCLCLHLDIIIISTKCTHQSKKSMCKEWNLPQSAATQSLTPSAVCSIMELCVSCLWNELVSMQCRSDAISQIMHRTNSNTTVTMMQCSLVTKFLHSQHHIHGD